MNIYRPPHVDNRFWTNFLWSLGKVGEISDKIVIVGDLNVDFLNIPQSHPVVDVMSNCSLIDNIHETTRISRTTRTFIDSIFTEIDTQVGKAGNRLYS